MYFHADLSESIFPPSLSLFSSPTALFPPLFLLEFPMDSRIPSQVQQTHVHSHLYFLFLQLSFQRGEESCHPWRGGKEPLQIQATLSSSVEAEGGQDLISLFSLFQRFLRLSPISAPFLLELYLYWDIFLVLSSLFIYPVAVNAEDVFILKWGLVSP